MASETFTRDNLIAGDYPIVTDSITIVSSASLVRGSVLGKITATGKYKLADYPSTDGSQKPVSILAEAADASGGDVTNVPIYNSGEFNIDKLVWGVSTDATSLVSVSVAGTTAGVIAATTTEFLRDNNIYLKDTLQVDP